MIWWYLMKFEECNASLSSLKEKVWITWINKQRFRLPFLAASLAKQEDISKWRTWLCRHLVELLSLSKPTKEFIYLSAMTFLWLDLQSILDMMFDSHHTACCYRALFYSPSSKCQVWSYMLSSFFTCSLNK